MRDDDAIDDRPQPTLSPRDGPPRRVPSTGGVSVAVHLLGTVRTAADDAPGGPPAVLAVHATGFHGRVWQPLATHLPVPAWAPDLRGHGASPLPPAGPGRPWPDPDLLAWERFADDVLAVVDALVATGDLEAGAVRAIGHSKGGAALVLAEQRRPGTFAALYLYEPVIFPPEIVAARVGNPLADGARRRRRSFPSVAAARANYASKPPLDALDPAALDAYVAGGLVTGTGADGVPEEVLACLPEVEATIFEQGMRHRAFDRLGEVTCPVTVACGRSSPGPAAIAPAVAAALGRGRLASHPDLGHFGPLEDPARIAAECTEHLGPW